MQLPMLPSISGERHGTMRTWIVVCSGIPKMRFHEDKLVPQIIYAGDIERAPLLIGLRAKHWGKCCLRGLEIRCTWNSDRGRKRDNQFSVTRLRLTRNLRARQIFRSLILVCSIDLQQHRMACRVSGYEFPGYLCVRLWLQRMGCSQICAFACCIFPEDAWFSFLLFRNSRVRIG